MGIIYNEKAKTFTLHTQNTTYQMQIDAYGFLLHLYYGRKTDGVMDYLLTYADRGFSGNPQDTGNDRTYSLDVLPQEFPCRLTGDFRSPVLDLVNADGSFGCDLRYQGYEICDGKYNLKGLPAVYAAEEEAQTLIIYMKDQVTGLQVELLYGVLPEYDVITRSAKVINTEEDKIRLTKAQAACIDFLHGEFDVISFYGRHAMERNMQRTSVGHGAFVIGSRRGTSSHQYNPMMILAEKETTEDAGICYGMSFVYSGGFKAEVEKDQFGQTRMQMGLQEEQFSYPLEKGQEFVIPEVILTCSNQGLGKLSQNLQRCIRKNLCRGKYKEKVRPVLINSWEACYFDFTGEDIYHLAEQAKDLGIDSMVIFTGAVPHDQMPPYYASCDVYVTASLSDTNSISMLEGMATGLPVLRRYDALNENVDQVRNGVNGYIFNSPEEMAAELRRVKNLSPEQLSILKASVIESVKRSGAEALANYTYNVYRKAMANAPNSKEK